MKKLLYPSSHWATNIGNPFFNLGAIHLLESSAPVKVIQTDLFAAKCFDLNQRQIETAFNYTPFLGGDIDALVLAGPMFDRNFGELFEPALKAAANKNIKVLLMSTGGIDYSQTEVDHCKKVLEKYPPHILTTRDRETYVNFKDFARYSYDGICTAWFVSDYFEGYSTPELQPYITSCFDITTEPELDLKAITVGEDNIARTPVVHGLHKKVMRLFQSDLPDSQDGYRIVRPVHCCVKRTNRQLFFKRNAFVSQTPYGFLNLYRNTSLTITDRLHAAVATMAFGNPARLYIRSKRPKLLNRVEAEGVLDRVFKADQAILAKEKENYKNWLTQALQDL